MRDLESRLRQFVPRDQAYPLPKKKKKKKQKLSSFT